MSSRNIPSPDESVSGYEAVGPDFSGRENANSPYGAPPINPKWGRAAVEAGARGSGGNGPDSAGSACPPAGGGTPSGFTGGTPPGGSWIWLPGGFAPEKPWRKRRPVLFWGGAVLLLAFVFCSGRFSVNEKNPIVGPKIAVVNVEGVIFDAGDIVAWMEKVRRDSSYKGAIVRINSPGGAVGPSQEIYAAVKRLAEAKPVVASMGALAASGGYYAALGADEIFAGPSTLTASIGVKMQIPNFSGLMRTIGVSETTLSTGNLKDAGSTWREMNPEEEAYFRALIADMYEEFIRTVAGERELPMETVRKLADGRAMTGRQAREAGLVDVLGDFHAAVQKIKERCKLTDDSLHLVEGPEKPGSFFSDLLSSLLTVLLERRTAVEHPMFFY